MTQDEFKKEIEVIEKLISKSFSFPDFSKKELWQKVKSIDIEAARQGTRTMFYKTNWRSLENVEKFWNSEAQRIESGKERHRSTEREVEPIVVNNDVMRQEFAKVNKILHGVGNVPSEKKSERQIDERRDMLLKQAEKLQK